MNIIKVSVTRPLTMLMFIVALIMIGWRGYNEMQVDRFPAVDFPFVFITTVFPGASPEDVEDLIVKPLEEAVSGLEGVDQVQAIAAEGFGVVTIAFLETVDGDQAASNVEREVARVRGQLPDDASDPSVVKADINAIPLMNIILSGPQSQDELNKVAEDLVRPRFESVKGVASVSIFGGREEVIAVRVDPAKLAAFDLPLSLIDQTFAINNLTFPVGTLEVGSQRSSIRSVGSFQSLAEIEDLVVSGGPRPGGGGPPALAGVDTGGLVHLSDVGTVAPGFKDQDVLQRYNGQDTVAINIVKTTDANAIDVADEVKRRMAELNDTLPGGAQLTVITDDSEFTRNSVNAVQSDLVLAILITGLVMLLFLHNIRSTFIVLAAIPTSMLATFLVMWAMGFTLNVLTLLALTLIIGILVDNSIVVIENIERHLRMHKTPAQAAIDGPTEIGLAAIAITLTDVIVYLPVAFTSGIVGQFFYSYGVTITAATMFSLFISFTLAPLLAAVLLKDDTVEQEKPTGLGGYIARVFSPVLWVWDRFTVLWEAGFTRLANGYGALIAFSLRNFWTQTLIIVIAVLMLLGSLALIPLIGGEFFPLEDDGRFSVDLTLPPGTNLATTDRAARMLEQIILDEVPETASILTRVGSQQGDIFSGTGGGSNTVNIGVRMVDKHDRERSLDQVIAQLRPKVAKIPDATVTISAGTSFGGGGGAIQVQVVGEDPDVLVDLANQIEEIIRTTPNTVDIVNNDAVRSPEAKIRLDRQRLTDLGLSPAAVAGTLRTAVTGSDVGDYAPEGAEKTEINLRVDDKAREDLASLLQVPVGYSGGKPVLLEQISTIERGAAPAVINRLNRQRVLTVQSGVVGSDSQGVSNQIESRINSEVTFPPNYDFSFGGETEAQRESFAQLGGALWLSIILIYILLVATFQDFLQPFAIMFALPMALIGILLGLFLSGNTLNIFSMLGIIMLVGVVTRNAILLIDFANILQREQGYERKPALVEAGRLRLRPILMTSATLIFALLPVLLSTRTGSETRQPLAAVLMGGSVTSSFLSLVLIPIIYNGFENLGEWLGLSKTAAGRPETDAAGPTASAPEPAGD